MNKAHKTKLVPNRHILELVGGYVPPAVLNLLNWEADQRTYNSAYPSSDILRLLRTGNHHRVV